MSLGWDCKAGSPERQKPCQQPGLGKLGRKADVAGGEAEPAHRQQGLGHPLVTVTPPPEQPSPASQQGCSGLSKFLLLMYFCPRPCERL